MVNCLFCRTKCSDCIVVCSFNGPLVPLDMLKVPKDTLSLFRKCLHTFKGKALLYASMQFLANYFALQSCPLIGSVVSSTEN